MWHHPLAVCGLLASLRHFSSPGGDVSLPVMVEYVFCVDHLTVWPCAGLQFQRMWCWHTSPHFKPSQPIYHAYLMWSNKNHCESVFKHFIRICLGSLVDKNIDELPCGHLAASYFYNNDRIASQVVKSSVKGLGTCKAARSITMSPSGPTISTDYYDQTIFAYFVHKTRELYFFCVNFSNLINFLDGILSL